jgi:hypothetical protein
MVTLETVHGNSEGILTSDVILETVHGNSEEILTIRGNSGDQPW